MEISKSFCIVPRKPSEPKFHVLKTHEFYEEVSVLDGDACL